MLLPDTIEFLTTTKKLSIVSAIAVFSNPVRTAISFTISDFVIRIKVQKNTKAVLLRKFMQRVIQTLSRWYNLESRDLPWRQTKDPYKIWISEVILQQTRVAQGIGYYEQFIHAMPNFYALSCASEQDVLKLWQGLGYYSRARNLHMAAKQVRDEFGGVFPSTYTDILRLRGVGKYTAAAIASFAFGEKVPAIDGNVKRVGSRLFGLRDAIHTSVFEKSLLRCFLMQFSSQMQIFLTKR